MKYVSLYDYLGYAAGNALGKRIAEIAASMGIQVKTRQVCNPTYTGKVCLYPETFLDLYFKK